MSFAQAADSELVAFAGGVAEGLTNNTGFSTPPVPLTALQTQIGVFNKAYIAASDGGKKLTAIKNQERANLLDLVHKLALYVQGEARYDLALLLSSGFEACNTNRSQSQLDKPAITGIVNETSGQMVLRATPIVNARLYEVQTSTDGSKTWVDMDNSPGARRIIVSPLTPGTTYTVRLRALGGSTGYSEWSDAVTHMAM